VTIFYWLRFETSLFVGSYDSQDYGGVRVRVALRLAVYRPSVRLGAEPLETRPDFFSQMNTCGHSPYITSFLTRGWVCHIQLLRGFARAFILGSESRGTRDHILLSQIRDYSFVASPTRRTTVEVFDSASMRETCRLWCSLSLSLTLRPTVSRPVYLGIKHPSGTWDQIFITIRLLRVC
jgi:hypothetical protein